MALAWLLAQDGVTGPIIGPRTIEQLDGASLRSLEIKLAPDTLTRSTRSSPAPAAPPPKRTPGSSTVRSQSRTHD